jgi:hypothetical protein
VRPLCRPYRSTRVEVLIPGSRSSVGGYDSDHAPD